MQRPKIGISTIAASSKGYEETFAGFELEVLELCSFDDEQWSALKRNPRPQELRLGVHCPLPFSGWVPYFEITGPDAARQREAVALVARTIQSAREVGADYVVVHFPTVVRGPVDLSGVAPEAARRQAASVAIELSELASRAGVRLLLENVGPNPCLCRAEHYCELFEQTPALQMCLDFGHAHVLDIGEDVYSFTQKVAPFVASIHLYNANPNSYRVGSHHAPSAERTPELGWMDLPRLLKILRETAPLEYVIFEHSKNEDNESPEVLSEIRSLQKLVHDLWA
jgi:sugar phosphate isomerase/epimerase